MFATPPKIYSTTAKLSSEDTVAIYNFIQGAVYCFCKNCPNQRFSGRILFGGENRDWNGTPLQKIHNWHVEHQKEDPYENTAKDLGWMLLQVLNDDSRTFKKITGYPNEYEWIR